MEALQYLARRLFMLFMALFMLIVALFIGLFTYQPESGAPLAVQQLPETASWEPRDILDVWESVDPLVQEGYQLVSESPKYMGPAAASEDLRYTGNNLACTNCHMKGGTQEGSAAWVGITERFPQFLGRANQVSTLEDRINGCMQRSMNGKKLPEGSRQMKAIVAYMEWLGSDVPGDKIETYKGYARLNIPEVPVDLDKGKEIYTRECAVCHGQDGQGISRPDPSQGYLYPPLWGPDSYNDGAGMHRVITAAEFIRSNMPFGMATLKNPKLSDEEAFHVAGYINSFPRPHKSNTEGDYPDLKLKPVSSPYGPWADDFSAEQHKYGPFPPIIAYYKKAYNITKTK
jgi:thiosulfate dehydrogenase